MTRYKFKKYISQIDDWLKLLGSIDNLNREDLLIQFIAIEIDDEDELEYEYNESEEEYLLRVCTNLLTYCEDKQYYEYCVDILALKKKLENENNKQHGTTN